VAEFTLWLGKAMVAKVGVTILAMLVLTMIWGFVLGWIYSGSAWWSAQQVMVGTAQVVYAMVMGLVGSVVPTSVQDFQEIVRQVDTWPPLAGLAVALIFGSLAWWAFLGALWCLRRAAEWLAARIGPMLVPNDAPVIREWYADYSQRGQSGLLLFLAAGAGLLWLLRLGLADNGGDLSFTLPPWGWAGVVVTGLLMLCGAFVMGRDLWVLICMLWGKQSRWAEKYRPM
jgi:hypothetical protein